MYCMRSLFYRFRVSYSCTIVTEYSFAGIGVIHLATKLASIS